MPENNSCSIKLLRIDPTANQIEIEVETAIGANFTEILIWNKDTFKVPSLAIDVSNLIDGSTNIENILVPKNLLGVENISGIYFIQFKTNAEIEETCETCPSNTCLGVVANLVPFYECLMNRVNKIDVGNCGEEIYIHCSKGDNELAYFITSLLQTLGMSIEMGYFEDAIVTINTLEDICEPCNSCDTYKDGNLVCGYGYGILNNVITNQANIC